jgi:tetratricopeptide (TPR) repeat protein
MHNHCPKCLNPLPDETANCDYCDRQMEEFASSLKAIVARVESKDYATALASLNQVIDTAPPARLAECYAIRGFAQLKQLDFQRAEEDCTESLSLDWEQAQTYAWRAAARGEQGKWHLAFDDLDRAYEFGGALQDRYLGLMEVMSEHARDYYRNRAQIGELTADSLFERGWTSLRNNNFDKAILDFTQALKREPHHPWASAGLAEVYLKKNHLKGLDPIRALCDDALHGSLACRRHALRIRAQLYWEAGDILDAKNDLKTLADQVRDNVLESVQCVELMMKLGDYLAAIDLLNQLHDQNAARILAVLKRGDCFAAICNYGLALNDYTQYLDCFPHSVPALVRRAKMHLASKHSSKALPDLKQAIELEPNHFEANLRLGQVYCDLEKFDLALNHCRLAVQIDGSQAEGFSVLASIYNRLNEYRQSVEEYSRSIELAKTTAERAQYRFLRGIAAYESEDLELALADFRLATEERPYHAGSWIWKAAGCARQEDWAGAILALQKAIEVRPTGAQQYQKLGHPIAEKAIQHYRRQEQRQGQSTPASLYLNRGMAHQFLEQHAAAVLDYTQGLSLKPKDHDLLARRGQSLMHSGHYSAAIEDFTTVLIRNPNDHLTFYHRALARIAHRETAAAKEDLLTALRLAPNQPRYALLLGEMELNHGHETVAMNQFDRAILLDPTNPLAYRMRGRMHAELGNFLAAIGDVTHSLQLYPMQPELLVLRGEAYLKSNQPLTALEDFEAALAMDERCAKAYAGRATVLVIQRRHEYALIWLTKAIHRFRAPHELAEILLARGKVYSQMARYQPAISDFTLVVELLRNDPQSLVAARFHRALAKIQMHQLVSAQKDLRKILSIDPKHVDAKTVSDWLMDTSRPMPAVVYPASGTYRPTRPAAQRTGIVLTHGSVTKWQSDPPYNMWIIRNEDKKEYGPVPLPVLADWASEGRLVNGMRLLRSDWSKWKRIEKIFPEITPLESIKGLIEEFPELDLKSRSGNNKS